MKKKCVIGMVLLTLLVVTACSSSGQNGNQNNQGSHQGDEDEFQQLFLGAVGTTSSHYSYFATVAEAINGYQDNIFVTVVETGGGKDNLERALRGELPFFLSSTQAAYEALHGLSGRDKNENLRWFWTYGTAPVNVFVRKDSGITSIEELDGKKVAPGGQGSDQAIFIESAYEVLGIKPDYYRGSIQDSINAVRDNQIIGTAKLATSTNVPDASVMELGANIDLTFLSFTDEQLDQIIAEYPYFLKVTMPPNTYENQPNEIKSIGQAFGAAAVKDLPQKTGYEIIKAVFETQEDQALNFPSVADINYPELLLETASFPIHAGAVQYLKELGYDVPDYLIPPEYVE